MAELLFAGLPVLTRFIGRVIGWLWRKATGAQKAPPSIPAHLPPGATAWANRHSLRSARMPYRKAAGILTKGEQALWHPLIIAVAGKYCLFSKVRLADVACCPDYRLNARTWFRRIANYHVDFVLCDLRTTAPLLVIELDDRSHFRLRQIKRDKFKDDVLRTAGVPIYRIPAQQAYDPIELGVYIEGHINGQIV